MSTSFDIDELSATQFDGWLSFSVVNAMHPDDEIGIARIFVQTGKDGQNFFRGGGMGGEWVELCVIVVPACSTLCRVSLSTQGGVHSQPNEGNDQSLYFINFIIK